MSASTPLKSAWSSMRAMGRTDVVGIYPADHYRRAYSMLRNSAFRACSGWEGTAFAGRDVPWRIRSDRTSRGARADLGGGGVVRCVLRDNMGLRECCVKKGGGNASADQGSVRVRRTPTVLPCGMPDSD